MNDDCAYLQGTEVRDDTAHDENHENSKRKLRELHVRNAKRNREAQGYERQYARAVHAVWEKDRASFGLKVAEIICDHIYSSPIAYPVGTSCSAASLANTDKSFDLHGILFPEQV